LPKLGPFAEEVRADEEKWASLSQRLTDNRNQLKRRDRVDLPIYMKEQESRVFQNSRVFLSEQASPLMSKIKSFFGGFFAAKKPAVEEVYVEKVDEALEEIKPPVLPEVDIMRQPVTQSRVTLFQRADQRPAVTQQSKKRTFKQSMVEPAESEGEPELIGASKPKRLKITE